VSFSSIAFVPLLPWLWLALLSALLVLVLGYGLWRRARGVPARMAAAALLALTLAGPVYVVEQRQTQPDVALVVRDVSPSMTIGDRKQAAERDLAALRAQLSRMPHLELRVVDAGAASGSVTEDQGTRLFSAVGQALADVPKARVAGIVLITDGQVHDIPDPPQRSFDAPLHVLLAGHPDEGDRRLILKQVPAFGIVGKPVSITLRVEDIGGSLFERQGYPSTAKVTLRRDGGEPNTITVPVGRDVQVPITLDHEGPTVLEASASTGPKDLILDNNRAAVVIDGVRDRLKVLLISGEPYPGERTWRNLLKADPSVDLVHFTILRPPQKLDRTPVKELSLIVFPVHELFEEKLAQFDLVIFDRYHQTVVLPFDYLENIVNYVRNGGALLEADAQNRGQGEDMGTLSFGLFDTPLATILPTQPTGRQIDEAYRPWLTPLGARHPVTAGLPGAGDPEHGPSWGRWFHQVETTPREGDVLLSGIDEAPLLVLDHVGKGRVAQLLSDDLWLWTRGFDGGGPQAELLRRLFYWLMKEPDLEENDLRASIAGDQLTILRKSLHDDNTAVTVTGPEGVPLDVTLTKTAPGRASATLQIARSGLYRVTDGTRTALAAAGALNPIEFAEVVSTPDKLAPLVAASGGGIAWGGTGARLPSLRAVGATGPAAGPGWFGFRRGRDYVVTGVTETPLLPPWAGLALVGSLLALAWWREGR
jgi:hypothetical protein